MTLRTEAVSVVAPRPAMRRAKPGAAAVERRMGHVTRQIERALGHHVLPRILAPRPDLDPAGLDALASLAIAGDTAALAASVRQLQQSARLDAQQVCLELLTPLARHLGLWWEEDRCGFVEVTLGLLALQEVLRALAPGLGSTAPMEARRSALMIPLPGEQHSFGIAMVGEFFRAAGWQVCQDGAATLAELGRRVAREWFGIVALSCGGTERLADLPRAIAVVRAHSFNPDVAVMVGGAALQGNDAADLAAGADATARDAAEALRRAEALVGRMALQP